MALSSDAYAGMADAWADRRDARLRAAGPAPGGAGTGRLRGVRALDAGAGSGVAGDALRARGARVVAADREFDMASVRRPPGRR